MMEYFTSKTPARIATKEVDQHRPTTNIAWFCRPMIFEIFWIFVVLVSVSFLLVVLPPTPIVPRLPGPMTRPPAQVSTFLGALSGLNFLDHSLLKTVLIHFQRNNETSFQSPKKDGMVLFVGTILRKSSRRV
jgi:hypothetical protein